MEHANLRRNHRLLLIRRKSRGFGMAINCAEAMWLLSRKFDDKITEKDARLLNEHLQSCAECKRKVVWVAKADRVVSGLLSSQFRLGEMVSESVEAVRQYNIIERGGLRVWHVILICVIVAAVVLGLIFGLRSGETKSPKPKEKPRTTAPKNP